jgi:hypothetical protein
MKALSLHQPWASLVVDGHKRIETRSWSTPYRGPLAIHASKAMTQDGWDLTAELAAGGIAFDATERGAIIGMVDLVDVVRVMPPRGDGPHRGWHHDSHRTGIPIGMRWDLTEFEQSVGDFTPGRFAWLLMSAVRHPKPIPAVGHLGLWETEP